MPEINYLAIIVAAIVPNALGALYYGPLLGNQLSILVIVFSIMGGILDAWI